MYSIHLGASKNLFSIAAYVQANMFPHRKSTAKKYLIRYGEQMVKSFVSKIFYWEIIWSIEVYKNKYIKFIKHIVDIMP